MTTKRCPRCKAVKEVTEFYKNKSQPGGLSSCCKECFKTAQKKYRQSPAKQKMDKESAKIRRRTPKVRNQMLIRKYGISLDQWQGLFNTQDGCCAICSKHQSELKQTLNVDHSHKTGIIRGLLCSKCNAAIGLLQDSSRIAKKAMEYLNDNCC